MTALATAAMPQIANAVIDPKPVRPTINWPAAAPAAAPTKRAGEKTPPNMPNPMQRAVSTSLNTRRTMR